MHIYITNVFIEITAEEEVDPVTKLAPYFGVSY